MDFRIKCAMQQAFSHVPGGRNLNYLMQRYVTKSLPISDSQLDGLRVIAAKHLAGLGRRPKMILDFGCGWDLALPILMAQMSGAKVIAADIQYGLSRLLVQDILRRLGCRSLKEAGVTYRVFDMRRAPYASGMFDLITTTSVLEHIPATHLPAIMDECRRLLSPGGVCSFHVCYQDHWSHFDRSLPPMNYLRFTEAEWRRYNPALQYQNRLLHSDYVRSFEAAGLTVTCDKTVSDSVIPVAPQFRHYSPADLRTTHGWFVLGRARRSVAQAVPKAA